MTAGAKIFTRQMTVPSFRKHWEDPIVKFSSAMAFFAKGANSGPESISGSSHYNSDASAKLHVR
jgi:hypothetical protein